MIKASELRIGNILRDGHGALYKVEAGDIALLLERPDTGECRPVLLTPEILQKAGFKLRSINGLELADYGDYVFNIKTSQFFISPDSENDRDTVIVESLHHLQNLYFALTQTELNFTL